MTDYLAVSAGFVAEADDILLEAFDVHGNLVGSSLGDDGFGPDGRHLAVVDLGGNPEIASFRVSTPAGDTFGVRRIYLHKPRATCIETPDDGVLYLPPDCEYWNVGQYHAALDDVLPFTGEIIVGVAHKNFVCSSDPLAKDCGDGNPLDGDLEIFDSNLVLTFQGTGDLSGFHRTITLRRPRLLPGCRRIARRRRSWCRRSPPSFRARRSPWSEIEILADDPGDTGDRFGFSVASDGSTLVVAAPYHDGVGYNSGVVYVFQR